MQVRYTRDKRLETIVRLTPRVWESYPSTNEAWQDRCAVPVSVLDVGARDGRLGELLMSANYTPADLIVPGTTLTQHGIFPLDIEAVPPSAILLFTTVAALDVLEHTDDIHQSLRNLCSWSERWVVLSLPNCYYLRRRLHYIVGRPIAFRYKLELDPRPKGWRHKWVYVGKELSHMIEYVAHHCGFDLTTHIGVVSPKFSRWWWRPIIVMRPGLFVRYYVFVLERR